MKLRFCKIKENDLELIRSWRMMPEVSQYMYTDPQLTAEDQKKWFERIESDSSCKYWLINVDGSKIGLVCIYSIDLKNKKAGWGYYIASEAARGKGVGKNVELNTLGYVFDTLGLNKLWCEVLKENEIVVKIHEKYGSKIEGVRRQHVFKNNEYRDVIEMGILTQEWEFIKNNNVYEKVIIEE